MQYRKWKVILLAVTPFIFLVTLTVPVFAAESYSAFASPTYSQEINTGTTLQLSVANATTFTTYTFTWRVTDPAGTTTTASKSTGTFFATSFVQTVVFPRDFSAGALTNYVGNYTVHIDQTAPNPTKTNVASTQFEIGLAPAKTIKRTYLVAFKAQGYTSSDNVTIDLRHAGTSLPGFPTFTLANSTGQVSFQWRPPASTVLGASIISFRGSSTLKVPNDAQTITVVSANVTVSGLTLVPGILERTQSVEVRFSASYLSGVNVQTGSAAVRIVESDSITTHYIVASYNSTIGLFWGSYRVPLSGLTGTWTIYVDRNSTDDGYGNVGPTMPTSAQLAVQQAVLSVIISPLSQQYQANQTIGMFATVSNPDGTPFNVGIVTATFSSNNSTLGNPVDLVFVPSSGWTGTYTVGSKDPLGTWTVLIQASDVYGNHGQAAVSTTIIPPPGSTPQATSPPLSLPLFLFLLAVVGIGSGIGGTFLWKNHLGQPNGLPFDSLFQLLGGEIPERSTVLILGAPDEDATSLALQLASRSLDHGAYCGLLAYGATPAELTDRMKRYGWRPRQYLEKGTLAQIDCYSRTGSDEGVKNPLDFGEVGVKVGSILEKASTGNGPVTVLIDSLTNLFRSSPPRKVFGFLSLLAEKVKNDKGILLLPVEKNAVPAEVMGVMEGLADGIIELGVSQSGNKTLTVRKTFGRHVKPPPVEYDLRKEHGMSLRRNQK